MATKHEQYPHTRGREITIRIPKATWERVMTIANEKGILFDEAAKEMFLRGFEQVRREVHEKQWQEKYQSTLQEVGHEEERQLVEQAQNKEV